MNVETMRVSGRTEATSSSLRIPDCPQVSRSSSAWDQKFSSCSASVLSGAPVKLLSKSTVLVKTLPDIYVYIHLYTCVCVCSVTQSYPTLCNPMDCSPPCPWDSPAKNTGVGCHFLFQGIFPTTGIEPESPAGRFFAPFGKPKYIRVCVCVCVCVCAHVCHAVLNCFSCVQFFVTLWAVDCQSPLSMGFSRHKYQSGWPCPPPGDLPDPGIEPSSLMSSALAGGFFTTSTTWEAYIYTHVFGSRISLPFISHTKQRFILDLAFFQLWPPSQASSNRKTLQGIKNVSKTGKTMVLLTEFTDIAE